MATSIRYLSVHLRRSPARRTRGNPHCDLVSRCRKKIRERNLEKERRRREEAAAAAAAIPPAHPPPPWDATLRLINEAHPAVVHCYSKFKLSMNTDKKVSCECVAKESLQDMLRRVDSGEYVLPISKAEASYWALETLGSVEGESCLETMGYAPKKGRFIDRTGCTVCSVLMVSRGMAKDLTVRVLVDKLNIVMDDGMIMSCCSDVSVNIHCDYISSSELLKTDWAYHILCKNIDGEGRTSFSTLVHLKKKLQLQLTEEELGLYNMSVIDGEEENLDLAEPWRKLKEWVPPKPKPELPEVELHDCNLFSVPWAS